MSQYAATIDLGTNTFHLLIAKIKADQDFELIHRERIPVMIGRGGINQGIIIAEAEQRALDALASFRAKLTSYKIPVGEVHCTATSAFRNAKNGKELVASIKQETGIQVDIISGDQEAEYIFYGVRHAVPISRQDALIMDIGGGSVEFILCNQEQIIWKQSFEIGAQRLLDRFDIQDPITENNIQDLLGYFSQTLAPLSAVVEQHRPKTLIGASGTFDTLSDIHVHRNAVQVNENATELPLTYEAFQVMLQDITRMNRQERLKIPGMIEMRVDMIVVASWLIEFVLATYHIREIRISSYALKEGLLVQLAQKLS